MYAWQARSSAGRLSSRADFVKVSDGIAASMRQFSISARAAAEGDRTPKQSAFRKILLSEPNSSSSGPSSNVVAAPNPNISVSRGGLDARSLAAKPSGDAKLARPPGLLLRRGGPAGRGRGAGQTGGRGGRGGFNARGGGASLGTNGGRGGSSAAGRGRGGSRSTGPDGATRQRIIRAARAGGNDENTTDPRLVAYEQSIVDANRKEPVTYTPESITRESLSEDWPSLPLASSTTSNTASAAAIVESKINYISNRLPNEHEPIEYLAERFWDGELIAFKSEEEKEQVTKIVNERIDEIVQKKKEKDSTKKYEPKYKGFETLSAETQRALFDTLLRGSYAPPKPQENIKQTPLMGELTKNLTNNHTWDSAMTQKFMAKINSLVPTKAQGLGTRRRAAAPSRS